jgi:multidrug resistance efflux pump
VKGSNAQIDQLRADKNRISAQLDAARSAHKRNDQLFKEGVIAESDFETSLSNLRALESSLAAAEAALKASETG